MIKNMVNILPFVLNGATSLKPVVDMVITVIYKASRGVYPSKNMYPAVPPASVNTIRNSNKYILDRNMFFI
jgi:hypothetical protein